MLPDGVDVSRWTATDWCEALETYDSATFLGETVGDEADRVVSRVTELRQDGDQVLLGG